MAGLLESAAAILSSSEKRLEALSQNISNVSTPGYKRQVGFSQYLENSSRIGDYSVPLSFNIASDDGKITESSNPLDLAIIGRGLFMVREGDSYFYTRSGQFSRNSDGAVINSQGMILQQAGGGDLILDGVAIEILDDGTVLDDGSPVGSVGLFEAKDSSRMKSIGGTIFEAPLDVMTAAEESVVKQGMIEGSNVVLSDEMVNLMANVRQAEMGGQIVRYYDQLIGQAISTFSRSGK